MRLTIQNSSFLVILVGINPRRNEVWMPVVSKMRRRLFSWKYKNLSLGGRVVLINAILSNLPIFYLSFYKAPKVIIDEFIKIQRGFLWGGVEEMRKLLGLVGRRFVCLRRRDA